MAGGRYRWRQDGLQSLFRGEGEREWKMLKANTHETTFALDGDALADGNIFSR